MSKYDEVKAALDSSDKVWAETSMFGVSEEKVSLREVFDSIENTAGFRGDILWHVGKDNEQWFISGVISEPNAEIAPLTWVREPVVEEVE